jgi:hypothetical protein
MAWSLVFSGAWPPSIFSFFLSQSINGDAAGEDYIEIKRGALEGWQQGFLLVYIRLMRPYPSNLWGMQGRRCRVITNVYNRPETTVYTTLQRLNVDRRVL